MVKQNSSNSLLDKILKYIGGYLGGSKIDPIILAKKNKLHKRMKSDERDILLIYLETYKEIPDLKEIEELKELSQPDDFPPDCFTIKDNWKMGVTVQAANYNIFNLSPQLIKVKKEERNVINQLMRSSQWTLTNHFSIGHSPTEVYLARRFEERELHVLKVGRTSVIEAEYKRFQQSKQWHTLPETAQLKSWFIPPDNSVGGLNYEVAGGHGDLVETLGQHFSKKIVSLESGQVQAGDMNSYFAKVINRVLLCARPTWDHHIPKQFSPVHTFDRLLPVNLELKAPPRKIKNLVGFPIDGTTESGDWSWLPVGAQITIQNFVVEEIRHMKGYLEVTLNVPNSRRLLQEDPEDFRSHRLRLRVALSEADKYYEGQEIQQLIGEVIETRLTRFDQELTKLPGLTGFDLTTKSIKVNSLGTFPNPFIILRRVLQDYWSKDRDVFVAEIHGDFHWHNIMVDREDGHLLAFVDLARVRYDYVLHDFLKLELSLITGLLKHPKRGGVLDNAGQLYKALDQVWKNNRDYEIMTLAKELQPLGLAILKIRQEVAPFLRSRDHREYYAGLLVYLLSSLKFKSLDPAGKLAAFGAALVVGQLAAQLFENTKD